MVVVTQHRQENAHVRTNRPKEPKSTNMKRKEEQTNDDIKPLVVERSGGRGLGGATGSLLKDLSVCLSVGRIVSVFAFCLLSFSRE